MTFNINSLHGLNNSILSCSHFYRTDILANLKYSLNLFIYLTSPVCSPQGRAGLPRQHRHADTACLL